MKTGARPENDGTAPETDDKHDDHGFQPQLTPMEMLELGIFGGWVVGSGIFLIGWEGYGNLAE